MSDMYESIETQPSMIEAYAPEQKGLIIQPVEKFDYYHYVDCPKNSTNPKCKEGFAFLDLSTKSSGECKKWYIAILILAILTLIFGCYCACKKD